MSTYRSLTDWTRVVSLVAAGANQFVVYMSTSEQDPNALLGPAPFLSNEELNHLAYKGSLYLLFPRGEDAYNTFHQVVGDDGPTRTNPYNGPVKVYACVCGPDGKITTENT